MTEAEKLKARGFDGLYHPSSECGCFNEDLRPCGETRTGCRGGYALGDGVYGLPKFAKAVPHQDGKEPT